MTGSPGLADRLVSAMAAEKDEAALAVHEREQLAQVLGYLFELCDEHKLNATRCLELIHEYVGRIERQDFPPAGIRPNASWRLLSGGLCLFCGRTDDHTHPDPPLAQLDVRPDRA